VIRGFALRSIPSRSVSAQRAHVGLPGLDRACREAPERDGGFLRESMSTMALHDISVATGGLVLEVQGDEEKE